MQLFLVILGAVLGLVYGANSDGFIFDSNICLFAGLTMIMPTLFNVKLSDIKLISQYKIIIFKSLLSNYLLLPSIAIAIGLATGNFGLASGLFLLSVLSGGGMVMHWIKKTDSDASLGFILLFINLILITLSLFMLHIFGLYAAPYFDESYADEINISNFAQAAITLLIVVPFILSRFIMLIKPLQNIIERYRVYISQGSIFVILFYLFALQSSQLLFELYDFEPELFYISGIAVFSFYLLVLLFTKFIFNLNSPQERAAYWHSVTRYITLALVISTFSTSTFGVSMILPIMFAYLVQIPFSIYIDKKVIPA